jgi:hypothetical protein
VEKFDAVVIGANTRGLVATYVLSHMGYRTLLIDKAPRVGGADGSFQTQSGTVFDYGMHVLDFMRSEVTTKLFLHVIRGEVSILPLKRGIVMRKSLMPYAPTPEEMPEEIRNMLPDGPLVDKLGDQQPTRKALAKFYGGRFADLILDEVLPSFPAECRHREFGVDEGKLLANIYPWFFPRALRVSNVGDESRQFHDLLRAGIEQRIMYPRVGGFGGFANAFLESFEPDLVEVVTAARDMLLNVDPGTQRIEDVEFGGRRAHGDRYFWAASWPALCETIDVPCQAAGTDRVVIGSFKFNRAPDCDFHELLIGDPELKMNRVYFPGSFREPSEPILQVEYAFPVAEDPGLDPDQWRELWLGQLEILGIIGDAHRVEESDFKSVQMHFNGFGMEGEALHDADPSVLRRESNIYALAPSMANLNVNRYVPRVIKQVTAVLAEGFDQSMPDLAG